MIRIDVLISIMYSICSVSVRLVCVNFPLVSNTCQTHTRILRIHNDILVYTCIYYIQYYTIYIHICIYIQTNLHVQLFSFCRDSFSTSTQVNRFVIFPDLIVVLVSRFGFSSRFDCAYYIRFFFNGQVPKCNSKQKLPKDTKCYLTLGCQICEEI